jgi:hypothetical protein
VTLPSVSTQEPELLDWAVASARIAIIIRLSQQQIVDTGIVRVTADRDRENNIQISTILHRHVDTIVF